MRILVVAMAYSIHTAQWVRQIVEHGWDVHVFDMQEGTVGAELSGVTAHTFCPPWEPNTRLKALYTVWPFRRGAYSARRHLPRSVQRAFLPTRRRSLCRLLPRLRPDIVHSLEMQHQSYPLLDVHRELGASFQAPWIYSSWGSDLFLFKDDPAHRGRIAQVLRLCDWYLPDCERDIALARALGFSGGVAGVFPVCGGMDIASARERMMPGAPSARRVVTVKGYQGWAGRALVALRAVEACADLLREYSVEVYLADEATRAEATAISQRTGLKIRIVPPGPVQQMIEMMGRSRVAMGLSISDGTPISMLEAMVMGALPIQSETSAAAEWIEHGRNGLIVPAEDWTVSAQALRRALTHDLLVDAAARANHEIVLRRLDTCVLRPRILAMYDEVHRRGARKERDSSAPPDASR